MEVFIWGVHDEFFLLQGLSDGPDLLLLHGVL